MPRRPPPKLPERLWSDFIYDTFLHVFSTIVLLFFREVHPRSTWRVPTTGPLIIVAAPHANQFCDPLILMRVLLQDCGRRVSFLIAAKSMKRKFIGLISSMFGSVAVGRAVDEKKPGKGRIYIDDQGEDGELILKGRGTEWDKKGGLKADDLILLPTIMGEAAGAEVKEVLGPEEVRLKKPFKGPVAYKQLTGREAQDNKDKTGEKEYEGSKYSVAPHVDQSAVYEAVFKKLSEDGCIGIFPEGGSHDRTELLPLKAGVAIMALGALVENPNCGVKIVACGMNYFHAHKFRSRAVIEFGAPVEIPAELVEKYRSGEKREAVGQVLEMVYNALSAVTVQTPDYDTLMLIHAVRRLYNPKGKKLPLPMIVELNRRLVKGYKTYKDDKRIISLKKSIIAYNSILMMLNIRDHQVSYAKFPTWMVIATLLYRIGKLLVLSIAVLPGTILFAPVFIAGKCISIKKSREALAASSVKIKAKDVVATWKILVALALAPALYTLYNIILAVWTYKTRIGGLIPEWVPLWSVFLFGYIFFPTITFAALRFGEVGMDIVKSIRPLVLYLDPKSGNTMVRLRLQRAQLAEQVTEVINELGPEVYPDFDHYRIISDPNHPLSPLNSHPTTPRERSRNRDQWMSGLSMTRSTSDGHNSQSVSISSASGHSAQDNATSPVTPITPTNYERRPTAQTREKDDLPRNESFKDLGNVGIFATRPTTPTSEDRSRSRHGSGSFGHDILKPLTELASKEEGNESILRERRGRMGNDIED